MRILLVNSVRRNKSAERSIAAIAKHAGWHVSYVRLGYGKAYWLSLALFILLVAACSTGTAFCAFYTGVKWTTVTALLCSLLLVAIYVVLSRVALVAQVRTGERYVHRAVIDRRINMMVTCGYGAVAVLRDPLARRLPMLMVAPGVGKYQRFVSFLSTREDEESLRGSKRENSLQGISYVAIAHDRTDKSTPIIDLLRLADTAPAGSAEVDVIAKQPSGRRFDDEEHLKTLIINSFSQGWLRLADEEQVTFATNLVDGTVTVRGAGAVGSGPFFDRIAEDGRSTDWLDQEDLKLLTTESA